MKFNLPPISKDKVLSLTELSKRLSPLIGTDYVLTYKPRTDGSRIRKLISSYVEEHATNAPADSYSILPPKKKGIPKLIAELIDTYLVTSGDSYNLQVWNRNPNGKNPLITYENGETISSQDIRFVLVKIDVEKNKIASIAILTPEYIVSRFGRFGKPTIKNQLLVGNKERNNVVSSKEHILFFPDTEKVERISKNIVNLSNGHSSDYPINGKLLKLSTIKHIVAERLVGMVLDAADTKTRGQLLEKIVIQLLGYRNSTDLVGGYPDVPNQLLEVKLQDAQTVDLGKFSPQFEEVVNEKLNLTTLDVRYLIALTNKDTGVIEGVILSSGKHLSERFSYVSGTSYKCQRSIPMSFFDSIEGQCVINP